MSLPALALALALAQLASGVWSSGRPPECASETGRVKNVWERAKSPELKRYCDLVASAASKLAGVTTTPAAAQGALDAAQAAEAVLPGHAAPRALKGRAFAALGKLDDALAALRDAQTRDAGSLDDPFALLAWARVLARTGHPEEAIAAYLALLPRASSLSSAERASAALEAGLVAMAGGPVGLNDAVAALREALRDAQDDAQAVAVLALALALDRRGDRAQGRELLSSRARGDPREALTTPAARDRIAATPAEAHAMAALALETINVAGARDAWETYLQGAPPAPWAAHARGHLAALGGKGAPAGRAR
jgi:tetratricopeptide (TPR) repeat protein